MIAHTMTHQAYINSLALGKDKLWKNCHITFMREVV